MDHLFKGSAARRVDAVKALDWSHEIATDPDIFAFNHARDLALPGEVTAMAFDPLQSLLAVGTSVGSLHVWGAPAASLTWSNRPAHQIKHLAFKGSLLCCIDVKDTLSVYDLAETDDSIPFRAAMHSVRSAVTCIEVSPAHSHLFLGLKDGTVDCFDLDRGVLSPYRIPNLWLEQEELLRRSGVPGAPSRRHIPVCTDLKIHPRDLNLLLIAYEGGVALWSILAKSAVRIFELVIPPGALGGGNDDPSTLFEERRPNVVCLAFRPDGLVFASGHEDGCIAVWALEDGDRPLLVRTLDREDVMTFDWGDNPGAADPDAPPPALREPIFRVAWSGFPEEGFLSRMTAATSQQEPASPTSSGNQKLQATGTMLSVLGGLLPSDPTGVHVLHFPAYEAPTMSWQKPPGDGLPQPLRQSLLDSAKATGHSVYLTTTPPEDFLLLPRSNPYFGGVFDPTAIVISMAEDPTLPPTHQACTARTIRAFSFPPSLVHEPTELRLPGPLQMVGSRSISVCNVVELPSVTYRRLMNSIESAGGDEHDYVPLRGGKASPASGIEARVLKMDRRRVLITAHLDLTVRFWDISAQSLIAETPALQPREVDSAGTDSLFAGRLKHAYPRPLHHLTLDVRTALAMSQSCPPLNAGSASPTIKQIQLGAENLELAVVLDTGSLVLFRIEHAAATEGPCMSETGFTSDMSGAPSVDDDLSKAMSSALEDLNAHDDTATPAASRVASAPAPSKPARPSRSLKRTTRKSGQVDVSVTNELETFDLAPLPRPIDSYRPLAMLIGPHSIDALALSDVGFVAAASGSYVYIIDLRGPDILYAENINASLKKGKASARVVLLKWVVADVAQDRNLALRLLAFCEDGSLHTITLVQGLDVWVAKRHPEHTIAHESLARPIACYILDLKGNERYADNSSLHHALSQNGPPTSPDTTLSVGIMVSAVALSLFLDATGHRVAKVDFGEEVAQAGLVRQFGSVVLLVIGVRGTRFVIALPSLGLVRKIPSTSSDSHNRSATSIDTMGDILESEGPLHIKVVTSIAGRQLAYCPITSLHNSSIVVPSPPTNASIASTFASWFASKPTIATPEGIDAALAGPNRPERKLRQAPRPVATQRRGTVRGASSAHARLNARTNADSTRDQLSHNADALDERGDRLRFLEDTMNDIGSAANDMVTQAKRIAARESSKSTFSSGMSSMKSFFR